MSCQYPNCQYPDSTVVPAVRPHQNYAGDALKRIETHGKTFDTLGRNFKEFARRVWNFFFIKMELFCYKDFFCGDRDSQYYLAIKSDVMLVELFRS